MANPDFAAAADVLQSSPLTLEVEPANFCAATARRFVEIARPRPPRRSRELAAGIADPDERFSVYFGLWAGSFVRVEFAAVREITDLMLREVDVRPDSPEAVTAVRLDGNVIGSPAISRGRAAARAD